jgi:Na+/proline symporter
MVQRMLTAKDKARSRLALITSGLADVPIAFGFLFIGVLLAVFYQLHPDPHLPAKNPEIFAYYILHQLPAGARGLLIAGVLATAMGSLSTALNALATSFTEDFWVPYFARNRDEAHIVRAVRGSTIAFALLLAAVGTATAAIVVYSPHARIIPVVLGVFGYTYGSLLGVFLLGLTTKNRGNDFGNLAGMLAGFLGVAVLSGLPWDLINAVRGQSSDIGPQIIGLAHAGLLVFKGGYVQAPDWLVQIEFPWRVMFGTIITYAVAFCFGRKSTVRSS